MEPEKQNEKESTEKVTLSLQDESAEAASYHFGVYTGYRKALFDVAQITLVLMGVMLIVEYNRR